MRKWIAGVAATIVTGTLVYWLTEGLRSERQGDGTATTAPTGYTSRTSGLSLFDLRGVYTLVHIEPGSPIHPQGLGIAIFPSSATEGRAEYRLPLGKLDGGDEQESILADESPVVFTGSKLQIKFGETMSMWRNVEFNDPYLVLFWYVEGQKHSWTFKKND